MTTHNVSNYVIRAAGLPDLEDFKALREGAGAGFTSLMIDDASLRKRLEGAAASFASDVNEPGAERYLLALEHLESGRVVGCAQVKATVGANPPFFNFRILRVAQASASAERRFDMDVLILVNEFTGCSEVGTLFVQSAHRAGGVGRALAQTRYMLMAAAPERFNERVVSELRGVVSTDGRAPFWEALGAHFFQMSFAEADKLSATTDNQFILDLMPKYPIYVDLLPRSARDVIGQTHAEGVGARRLLEWEGFRFDSVVDIFDGGPLLSVGRDNIRTRREARVLTSAVATSAHHLKRGLIAHPEVSHFRCAPARIAIEGDTALTAQQSLKAIGLEPGAPILTWVASDED